MASPRRPAVFASALAVATFVSNFLLFLLAYNRLATPYLDEGQRIDNANVIVGWVLGGYAVTAALLGLVVYRVVRRR